MKLSCDIFVVLKYGYYTVLFVVLKYVYYTVLFVVLKYYYYVIIFVVLQCFFKFCTKLLIMFCQVCARVNDWGMEKEDIFQSLLPKKLLTTIV